MDLKLGYVLNAVMDVLSVEYEMDSDIDVTEEDQVRSNPLLRQINWRDRFSIVLDQLLSVKKDNLRKVTVAYREPWYLTEEYILSMNRKYLCTTMYKDIANFLRRLTEMLNLTSGCGYEAYLAEIVREKGKWIVRNYYDEGEDEPDVVVEWQAT